MPPVPSTNICHVIYEPGITLCPIYYILCYVDGLAILSNRSNACNPVTSIAREHEVRMTSLRAMPPLCQPPPLPSPIQSLSSIIFCLIFARVRVYIYMYFIRSKFFSFDYFSSIFVPFLRFLGISLAGWIRWAFVEFLIFFWLFLSPLILESDLKNSIFKQKSI